jgi:hypothetical protein
MVSRQVQKPSQGRRSICVRLVDRAWKAVEEDLMTETEECGQMCVNYGICLRSLNHRPSRHGFLPLPGDD